MDLDLQ